MRECSVCIGFERRQKGQRSLLKGLSVIPVPASLFVLRGESAAAAGGLAVGAAATGGSAGVVAKAAAVAAAVTVAGGVGYTAGADPVRRGRRKAADSSTGSPCTGGVASGGSSTRADGQPSAARSYRTRRPEGAPASIGANAGRQEDESGSGESTAQGRRSRRASGARRRGLPAAESEADEGAAVAEEAEAPVRNRPAPAPGGDRTTPLQAREATATPAGRARRGPEPAVATSWA